MLFLRATRAILTLLAVMSALAAPELSAQREQYQSTTGERYYSLPDSSGAVAAATNAYRANPSVANAIALGTAQAGIRQFREALETFDDALRRHRDNPQLLRWRGHRFLTLREFGRAERDLRRATELDSTLYGAWYHLGVVAVVTGRYREAVQRFVRALPLAPDASERAGSVDWLWVSLMRASRPDEASALLARRPDSVAVNNAYARRLRLYRGEIGPDDVLTAADTADVQVSTLAFGLGNWLELVADSTRARVAYQLAIAAGGWPGFGFIVAEQDLLRLAREERNACVDALDPARFTDTPVSLHIREGPDDDLPRAARPLVTEAERLLTRVAREVQREVGGREGAVGSAEGRFVWTELGGSLSIIVRPDGSVRVRSRIETGMDRPKSFAAVRYVTGVAGRIVADDSIRWNWPAGLRRDSLEVTAELRHSAEPRRSGSWLGRAIATLFTLRKPDERPVSPMPGNATPTYPESQRTARIEGRVDLEFVIDTTGRIDLLTVRDLFPTAGAPRRYLADDDYLAFRSAVAFTLPQTRYRPASIGGCAVQQLVQQPFVFALRR